MSSQLLESIGLGGLDIAYVLIALIAQLVLQQLHHFLLLQ